MSVQQILETRLHEGISLNYLHIRNESHMHSGPATESHFKVTAVSPEFAGVPVVKRHQRMYQLLAAELRGGIHALALHTYTPEEWERKNATAPQSPDCMGGSH